MKDMNPKDFKIITKDRELYFKYNEEIYEIYEDGILTAVTFPFMVKNITDEIVNFISPFRNKEK
jgi:hypothetical protein